MGCGLRRDGPGIADEIATLLTRRLLPAAVAGNLDAFGISRLGRLNGAWYADERATARRPAS
jgi:beta-ribofuranosylaminobenzene 5'-phosphate synthase